jgi:hypothetical protein
VKEEPGDENQDEREDDGDAENGSDQGSSVSGSDSSDSDSWTSESAKQLADHDRHIEIVLPMPASGRFGESPSKESSEADDRSQRTDDSGETDNSRSDDNKDSGKESPVPEEIEPQSSSEYNDSENEQSESEQETYETPPQQLGNNGSDSGNQTNGTTLRGNSLITTVAHLSQARPSSQRSTINRKRKGRSSLTERVSKSPRVDYAASADLSHPSGQGFVEWEHDMEAQNQTQRDTTADADDLLFEEATQVMGLQRSWKRLMSGCHELRTREAYIRPVFYGIENLRGHIFNMQELYKQMQEDRRTGSITVDLKDDLQ